MPDIAMCKNETCPLKNECYRFIAIPDEHWQSYTLFDGKDTGRCFLPIEGRKAREVQGSNQGSSTT